MQATILGVQLDENDARLLKMVFDAKDKKISYLTPKKVEGYDAALEKLLKNGLIVKTTSGKFQRYSISGSGIEAYGLLPGEMVGEKKSKASKKDDISELKAMAGEMNKKLDSIIALLRGAQPDNGQGLSGRAEAFERSLVLEYNTLKSREFLSDGKVWHEQLKRIMMERHRYQDYEYDELLQQLKQQKLGMISLSQGKDKTWIEIRV